MEFGSAQLIHRMNGGYLAAPSRAAMDRRWVSERAESAADSR